MLSLILVPSIFILAMMGILYVGYSGPLNRVPRKSELKVLIFLLIVLAILMFILVYDLMPYIKEIVK